MNPPLGSGGQDSGGDSVCKESGRGASFKQGKRGAPGWLSRVEHLTLFFFLIFKKHLFFERQSMSGRGAEREGDTESEAGSRL